MQQIALNYPSSRLPGISPFAIGIVILAHGAVFSLLVSLDILPVPQEIAALMVQVLPPQPAMSEPTQPKPVNTLPQKQPLRSLEKLPTPDTAPEVSPTVPASVPAPAPSPSPSAAPPVEVMVIQPRFDANYLDNPAPVYPALSRRMGEEGKVLLRVYVEPAGTPSRIEIKTGSGSQRLDQAAEQAVWRWKFIPAKRGNEAVAAWVVVPISFNLRG